MIITLEYIIYLILISINIFLIFEKKLYRSILLYAAFSLLLGSLYIIYSAHDVALAEISVGSALVPIIFMITIKKYREFEIAFNYSQLTDFEVEEIKKILDYYAKYKKLRIKEIDYNKVQLDVFRDVFREVTVDLVIDKREDIIIYAKKSSYLVEELETKFLNNRYNIIRMGENERTD